MLTEAEENESFVPELTHEKIRPTPDSRRERMESRLN